MNAWSMRRLKSSAITFSILAVLFTVTAFAAEFLMSRSQQRIALEFILIACMVIAIQAYVGNSGLLSFGHVAFFAIAAYVAALAALPPAWKESNTPGLPAFLTNLDSSFILAVGLAVVAVLFFAAFTGVPIARMDASVVPMATLAMMVVVHSVINISTSWTRGPIGLVNVPDLVNVWTVLFTSLFITASALVYAASPWGTKLQAVREDAVAAAALGIPVARMRFVGWMVSAGLMAIGGSVWALNAMAFNPTKFFFTDTFALLAMLAIGGLGSVTGAVLGAAIVSLLSELLRNLESGFSIGPIVIGELPGLVQMATAVLILLVLIWRPRGILGNREAGELRWGKK